MRTCRCLITGHVEGADALARFGCALPVAPLVGSVAVITRLDRADGIEVVAAFLKIKIRGFLVM